LMSATGGVDASMGLSSPQPATRRIEHRRVDQNGVFIRRDTAPGAQEVNGSVKRSRNRFGPRFEGIAQIAAIDVHGAGLVLPVANLYNAIDGVSECGVVAVHRARQPRLGKERAVGPIPHRLRAAARPCALAVFIPAVGPAALGVAALDS